MKRISLLNLLTFFSAFLLFQIELIAAKVLLPQYGGSYMVWGACMVFFQAALLAGYCFAHIFLSVVGMSRYRAIHLGLMLLPLLFFPGKNLVFSASNENVFLAFDVFRQLLLTIGPVFFVLSTISIVAQVWLSSSSLPEQNNPYALYAWSNFGSFAALLTYPFIFEYFFDLSSQLWMWRVCYLLLIALCAAAYIMIPLNAHVELAQEKNLAPTKEELFRWFLLSAGGVIMFLSVTNILTMAIAPFPLLWIIPLGIYLLAFVLNFKRIPWCPSWISQRIDLIIGVGFIFYLFLERRSLPIAFEMIVLTTLLFVLCMYCQNQLAESRPAGGGNLTIFYLLLAFGGFVGGMATTWLMPLVSNSILEYVLGLTVIALAVKSFVDKTGNNISTLIAMAVLIMALFLWPLAFTESSLVGTILILALGMILFHQFKATKNALALTMILIFMLTQSLEVLWGQKAYLYKKRNYYGICRIFDYGGVRSFMHGTTLHGLQILDKVLSVQPTSYFGPHSPVAQVLKDEAFPAARVAVVGLGAGTLATYGRAGQQIDFYELDPEVYRIANQFFSFTKDSLATIKYFLGDARLALDKNFSAKYDILIIDAFGGDSIPTHLLTKEMMAKCRAHLTADGIVLFHVTNRYLKAGLVAGRSALAVNAHFCFKTTPQINLYELPSDWVAVTWSDARFARLLGDFQWNQTSVAEASRIRLWTDEYSNIMTVVKYDELYNSLKDFRAFN